MRGPETDCRNCVRCSRTQASSASLKGCGAPCAPPAPASVVMVDPPLGQCRCVASLGLGGLGGGQVPAAWWATLTTRNPRQPVAPIGRIVAADTRVGRGRYICAAQPLQRPFDVQIGRPHLDLPCSCVCRRRLYDGIARWLHNIESRSNGVSLLVTVPTVGSSWAVGDRKSVV